MIQTHKAWFWRHLVFQCFSVYTLRLCFVLRLPAKPGSPTDVTLGCHRAVSLSWMHDWMRHIHVFCVFFSPHTASRTQTLQVSQVSFRVICSALSSACDLTGVKNRIRLEILCSISNSQHRMERKKKNSCVAWSCCRELMRAMRWRLCVATVTPQPFVTFGEGCSARDEAYQWAFPRIHGETVWNEWIRFPRPWRPLTTL